MVEVGGGRTFELKGVDPMIGLVLDGSKLLVEEEGLEDGVG